MKTKAKSILSSLFLKIAIIVALNLVGSFVYLRLDFSHDKIYTLGKESKAAVRTLDDILVIKVFATADLPADFRATDRYLRDLLSEYRLNARSKFSFEYVDSSDKETFRNEAAANKLSFSVVPSYENDQMSFREVVYGITFEYKNKRESFNITPNIESKLEYEITTIIRNLKDTEFPEIAVYRDSTYHYLSTQHFEKALAQNYKVHTTDLFSVPEHVKVLLFTGVVDSLDAGQIYFLDQFVMRGGKLVVLQERVPLYYDPPASIESNFFDLMEHYGIKIERNLILDIVCDIQRMGMYERVPFPIFPVATGTNHPITRNMNDIPMYLTSGISQIGNIPGQEFIPLLRTSHNSAIVSGPDYRIEPFIMQRPTPEMFSQPSQTLGALFTANLSSYYTESVSPLPEDYVPSVKNAGIIVFADRELTVDIDNPIFQNRWYIVLNALDHFLGNQSMIPIRSRSIQSSFFSLRAFLEGFDLLYLDPNKVEQNIKLLIKISSVTLPSLLFLLWGLYIFLKNKAYRKRIAELYEKP